MNNYACITWRGTTVSESTQAWSTWTVLLVLWSYVDVVWETLIIIYIFWLLAETYHWDHSLSNMKYFQKGNVSLLISTTKILPCPICYGNFLWFVLINRRKYSLNTSCSILTLEWGVSIITNTHLKSKEKRSLFLITLFILGKVISLWWKKSSTNSSSLFWSLLRII